MQYKEEWRKYEDDFQRRLTKNFDTLYNTVGGLYVNVESWREEAVERLVAAGETAVKPLIQVLTGADADRRFWDVEYDRDLRQDVTYVKKAKAHAEEALKRIGEPALSATLSLLNSTKADVREAGARILNVIGAPAVDTLLVLLQRDNSQTRALAATALAGNQEERVISALLDTLRQEVEQYRRTRRREMKRFGFVWLVLVPLWVFVFWDNISRDVRLFVQIFLQVLLSLAALEVASTARRNIVTSLSHVTDIRMAGIMAACLFDKDAIVCHAAAEALKPILLQMRASDQQTLSSDDMELLVKALGSKDEALVVALLKAFEQVGDNRALPQVERLAKHGRTAKIRNAAEGCLPYLRVRTEEARQAKTLLRPAGIEEPMAAETLLRPAQGVAPVEENQLLRPS